MSSTSLHKQTAVDAHTHYFAVALLAYAEHNPLFADQLACAIKTTDWQTNIASPLDVPTQSHLTTEQAIRNAHWLLTTCNPTNHPDTTTLLTTWAYRRELPKDLVLGIVGLAVIGPTLGLIDKPKKKKKAELPVIITDQLYDTLSKSELVTLTSELSQYIIATELRLAAGNAYHMHPDTAEWSFEAGTTALYVVPHKLFTTISTNNQSVSHRRHDTHDAIAFSPAVAEQVIETYQLMRR